MRRIYYHVDDLLDYQILISIHFYFVFHFNFHSRLFVPFSIMEMEIINYPQLMVFVKRSFNLN